MISKKELLESDLSDDIKGMLNGGNSAFRLPDALQNLEVGKTMKVVFSGLEFRKKKTAAAAYPAVIEDIKSGEMDTVRKDPDAYYIAKVFNLDGHEFRAFPTNAENLEDSSEVTFEMVTKGDRNAKGADRYSTYKIA